MTTLVVAVLVLVGDKEPDSALGDVQRPQLELQNVIIVVFGLGSSVGDLCVMVVQVLVLVVVIVVRSYKDLEGLVFQKVIDFIAGRCHAAWLTCVDVHFDFRRLEVLHI